MRKTIVAASAVVLFVAAVGIVSAKSKAAETGDSQTTTRAKGVSEEVRAAREQWKLERQQALESMKQEKQAWREEQKQKIAADKCARITERIQNRATLSSDAKTKHMNVYNNLLSRIDKFIAKFDAFNASSSTDIDAATLQKLKDDRTVLSSMITAFQTSYADYFTKISAAKNLTCGTAEGEVRSALADAKVYLASVHDNAADIRTYVRTTIIPDLLAVKQNVAKLRGETGDAKEVEEEDDADKDETAEDTTDTDDNTTGDNTTGDDTTADNTAGDTTTTTTPTTTTTDNTATSNAAAGNNQ